MKRITGAEFVEMWKNPELHGLESVLHQGVFVLIFKDYEVIGEVTLEYDNQLEGLLLDSCFFSYSITIKCSKDEKEFLSGVFCVKTAISFIEIENCVIQKLSITENSSIDRMSLLDCDVSYQFLLASQSTLKFIAIEHTEIEVFLLEPNGTVGEIFIAVSAVNSMEFNRANVRTLRISGNATINRILIKNNTSVVGDIVIERESNVLMLETKNCFLQNIVCRSDSVVRNLRIFDTQCSNVRIYNATVKNVQVGNSQLSSIDVQYASLEGISLRSESIVMWLNLHYLRESRIVEVLTCTVYSITMCIDRTVTVALTKSYVYALRLVGKVLVKDTLFSISETGVAMVEIQSLINMGVITFNNVYPLKEVAKFEVKDNIPILDVDGRFILKKIEIDKSKFLLVNSDLGKTTFINCNLNAFDQFVFLNTKMLETFVADTVLPLAGKIETIDGKGDVAKLEQQRLALGQFKKIYENRGDVVKALEYHAQEMEVYRDYLREQKKEEYQREGHTKRLKFLNLTINAQKAVRELTRRFTARGERLVLFLNSASNFHGTNWVRATCVTLLVTWGMFTLYCLALGFTLDIRGNLFWKLFSYSFEFINPLRKADFLKMVKEDDITPLARCIDYFARIVVSYFAYQTIQAFRKFGKKAV